MINNLKDLERLFRLCRKHGIDTCRVGDITFKLGDMPVAAAPVAAAPVAEPKSTLENFPEGELTPEQLAFYSSGGLPEDDPWRE